MSNIGERLKLVRGKRSGEEFATSLGVHLQTLYRYERGERTPDIDFIQLVSKKESISLEWLISGIGSMHSGDAPSPGQTSPVQPPEITPPAACPRCAKLETKLEKVEQQRDDLMGELRQLWKENGELKAQVARYEAESHKPGIYSPDTAQTGA